MGACLGSTPTTPIDITQHYTIGNTIGKGNFAIVKKCVNRAHGEEYAIKIIDKARCQEHHDIVRNEVAILKTLSHPNIINLIDDVETDQGWFLVVEFMMLGDMFDYVAKLTEYSEENARLVMRDLLSALVYLHKIPIVHRDVKLENLLMTMCDNRRVVKLADFGLASTVLEPLTTVCGSPAYIAPEILEGSGYGTLIDIWSAGVIMYILLCGYTPFSSSKKNDPEEIFGKVKLGMYEFHSPYWTQVSEQAKELITYMMATDVSERKSAEDCLKHTWIIADTKCDNSVMI